MGVIGKTAAPGRLPDEAVAWAAFCRPIATRPTRSRNAPCRRRRRPQSRSQRGSIEIGYRVACQILRAYARTRIKVRSYPNCRHDAVEAQTSRRGQMQTMHCNNVRPYSITSSARTKKDSAIVNPNTLAVFKLTTSSKRVGRSAGRSAGLVPFRTLAAMTPASRKTSSGLGP